MTWKFGVDLLQQRLKTIPMFGASGGRYEFNRNRTLTNSNGTSDTGTGGIEFAQFLLGVYNMATLRETLHPLLLPVEFGGGLRAERLEGAPNLTLNLGLRYSLQLPRTEKYDRQGAFLPDLAQEYPLPQPVTLPDGRVITSAPRASVRAIPGAAADRATSCRLTGMAGSRASGSRGCRAFDWNSTERLVVRGGYGLSHATLTGLGRNPSPDFASGTLNYTFNTRVTDPNFVARICCNGPQWAPRTPEAALNIPEDGLLYLDGINVAANAVSPNATCRTSRAGASRPPTSCPGVRRSRSRTTAARAVISFSRR